MQQLPQLDQRHLRPERPTQHPQQRHLPASLPPPPPPARPLSPPPAPGPSSSPLPRRSALATLVARGVVVGGERVGVGGEEAARVGGVEALRRTVGSQANGGWLAGLLAARARAPRPGVSESVSW